MRQVEYLFFQVIQVLEDGWEFLQLPDLNLKLQYLELFLFLSDFSDGSSDDNAQRGFPETVGSLAAWQREHALQLSQTSQGTSSWTGLTTEVFEKVIERVLITKCKQSPT